MLDCQFHVTVAQRFGELLRKLWNPRNFKAHVSPHEMLQVYMHCFLHTVKSFWCITSVIEQQFLLVILMTNIA